MSREVPVRCGKGPLHIATRARGGWSAACGPTLRTARPVPETDWKRGREPRCPECDEIAAHAPTRKILRLIAGW